MPERNLPINANVSHFKSLHDHAFGPMFGQHIRLAFDRVVAKAATVDGYTFGALQQTPHTCAHGGEVLISDRIMLMLRNGRRTEVVALCIKWIFWWTMEKGKNSWIHEACKEWFAKHSIKLSKTGVANYSSNASFPRSSKQHIRNLHRLAKKVATSSWLHQFKRIQLRSWKFKIVMGANLGKERQWPTEEHQWANHDLSSILPS